eukprot:6914796-Prorocentrum_lima.AAC.1
MNLRCLFFGVCAWRCMKPTQGAISAWPMSSQANAPKRLLYPSCITKSQSSSRCVTSTCWVSISESSSTS